MATYKSAYSGPQIDEAIGKVLSNQLNGSSNRNLLDNAWFRVNQRGATSGTGIAYIADRWFTSFGSGGVTWSRTDDTVTIQSTSGSSNAYIIQVIEQDIWSFLNGKTVTVSAMLNDYSVIHNTFVWNSESNQNLLIGKGLDDKEVRLETNVNQRRFAIRKTQTAETFRAAKLEPGSVSTLANDAPPNSAEELAKCQPDFVRVPIVINRPYAAGVATSAQGTQIRVFMPLPTTMRATPTATLTGTSPKAVGNAQSLSVSAISVDSIVPGGVILLLAVSGAAQNQCYSMVGAGDATLDLSVDP